MELRYLSILGAAFEYGPVVSDHSSIHPCPSHSRHFPSVRPSYSVKYGPDLFVPLSYLSIYLPIYIRSFDLTHVCMHASGCEKGK